MSRSPSSALLTPFFGASSPTKHRLHKNKVRYPYSNLEDLDLDVNLHRAQWKCAEERC